jgi:hypothetical protein
VLPEDGGLIWPKRVGVRMLVNLDFRLSQWNKYIYIFFGGGGVHDVRGEFTDVSETAVGPVFTGHAFYDAPKNVASVHCFLIVCHTNQFPI